MELEQSRAELASQMKVYSRLCGVSEGFPGTITPQLHNEAEPSEAKQGQDKITQFWPSQLKAKEGSGTQCNAVLSIFFMSIQINLIGLSDQLLVVVMVALQIIASLD